MAIEFLYATDDIPGLVENLYTNGFFLSRSTGVYKDKPLTIFDAVLSLESDLLFPGSKVYWVWNDACSRLLQFVSCGKQSHPCYAGKQGRIAGYLSDKIQTDVQYEARHLKKIMSAYLKKHGVFKAYNGNAKMNCYFLANYEEMEEGYLQNPLPAHMCLGTGQIICNASESSEKKDKLDLCLSYFPAIQNCRQTLKTYWANKDLMDISFEFLCDSTLFGFCDFQRLLRLLSDNQKSVTANQKRQMVGESPPMSLTNTQVEHPHIIVFLDNPWQCWINCEHDYSGKPVVLWPE